MSAGAHHLRPSPPLREALLNVVEDGSPVSDVPLGRGDQLAVRTWVADLTAAGLAPATVRKITHVLAKVLQAAVDARLLAVNPAAGVPLPRVEHTEMRCLDAGQITELADCVPPRYRAVILIAGHGGLRFSELAGLRRRRVDPLRGRVHVVEVLVESGGQLHSGQPKTRAGRRTVTLPRRVADQLAEHMAGHTGSNPDAYVFTGPGGGPLRRAGFRSRVFVPAVTAAGLDPLRLHDLRHSAVSLWIAAGANAKQVATWAGHSSAGFTLDRYGHLLDDADDELAARLDRLLDHAQPPSGATVHRLGS
jgi:integrase